MQLRVRNVWWLGVAACAFGLAQPVAAQEVNILPRERLAVDMAAEGWAGIDDVQVLNGNTSDAGGAHARQGSQTLGTATQQGTAWTLAWEPTKYDHVQQHHLWVYAHSNVTGEERLLNRDINIVATRVQAVVLAYETGLVTPGET